MKVTGVDPGTDPVFEEGISFFLRFITPYGFTQFSTKSSVDKEGIYRYAVFRKEDRKITLHFSDYFFAVTYSIGKCNIGHDIYMKKLQVNNVFPGFSPDHSDAIQRITSDLQKYGDDFLSGSGEKFKILADQAMTEEKQKKAAYERTHKHEYSPDREVVREARQLFAQKRYSEVVKLLGQLKDPDDMTASEKLIFTKALGHVQQSDY